jgi:hypothetical protein
VKARQTLEVGVSLGRYGLSQPIYIGPVFDWSPISDQATVFRALECEPHVIAHTSIGYFFLRPLHTPSRQRFTSMGLSITNLDDLHVCICCDSQTVPLDVLRNRVVRRVDALRETLRLVTWF